MNYTQLSPQFNANGYPAIQDCDPVQVLACEQEGRPSKNGKVSFFAGRVDDGNGNATECTFATSGNPVSAGLLNCKVSVKKSQYGTEYTFWPTGEQANQPTAKPAGASGISGTSDKQCALNCATLLAAHGKIDLNEIGSYMDVFTGLLVCAPQQPQRQQQQQPQQDEQDDLPF